MLEEDGMSTFFIALVEWSFLLPKNEIFSYWVTAIGEGQRAATLRAL